MVSNIGITKKEWEAYQKLDRKIGDMQRKIEDKIFKKNNLDKNVMYSDGFFIDAMNNPSFNDFDTFKDIVISDFQLDK